MKILVRATNWIGDAVMSLPALRALRSQFPEAHISVLALPWVAALYEGERAIDNVILLEGARGLRQLGAKWRVAAALRRQAFDLAVLFPNSFESAALVRLSSARRRIGYARDGRSFLLTDSIALPKPGEVPHHQRFYYLEMLRRAGLIPELPEVSDIRLDGAVEARQRGESLFIADGVPGPIIGVSPGAAYGGAKRWLPERFAESARILAHHFGGSVVVFGSAAELDLCEEVARRCAGYNFAGETTLREFIDRSAACSVFLTNDSGAMHIVSALGVPCVTVFGPTDETATGPSGVQARLVREPVGCAFCLLRECPLDHACMTRVTAPRVVAEALHVISLRC